MELSQVELDALEAWLRQGSQLLVHLRATYAAQHGEPPKQREKEQPALADRPTTVKCEMCPALLQVGHSGRLPQFCRRCANKRGNDKKPRAIRPETVKCSTCPAEVAVGSRGRPPRFCVHCRKKLKHTRGAGRISESHSTIEFTPTDLTETSACQPSEAPPQSPEPAIAPTEPDIPDEDDGLVGPSEAAKAQAARLIEARNRIGAMLALAGGAATDPVLDLHPVVSTSDG